MTMAAINGGTEQVSDATQQDDSLTLGWRELYDDLQVHEYYPVDTFLVYMESLVTKGRLVQSLDFSGIDVLTDDVFIALRGVCEKNKTFAESIKSLRCVGCVHLTDCAIEQVTAALPKLETLYLDACHQLTDVSLYHLKRLSASLKYVGLSGTGISQEPQWGGDVKVVLDGCAIDSSGTEGTVEGTVPLTYKLVMLSRVAGFGHLLSFLTQKDHGDHQDDGDHQEHGDQKDPSDETPLDLSCNVKFLDLEHAFSVFKCGCEIELAVPFLSKSVMYFIVLDLDDKSEENPHLSIMNRLNKIRGEVLHTTFMIVLLHGATEAEERSEQVKTLNKYLRIYLDKQQVALNDDITLEAYSGDQNKERDFAAQQRYSRSFQAASSTNRHCVFELNTATDELTQHWPQQAGVVDPKKLEELKEKFETAQDVWFKEYRLAAHAIEGINKSDISQVMSMKNPPRSFDCVAEGMCILFGLKPVKKKEIEQTYWPPFMKVMRNYRSLNQILNYDIETITADMLVKLEPLVQDPEEVVKKVMMASSMMAAFFKWIVAMYHAATNVVPIKNEYRTLMKQQEGATMDNGTAVISEKGPRMLLHQMRRVMDELDSKVYQLGRKDVTALDRRVLDVLTSLSSQKICTLKTVQECLTTADNVEVDIRTVSKAVDKVHKQGKVLSFAEVPGHLIVTDVTWFMRVMVLLQQQTDNISAHNGARFKALAPDVPIFDLPSIQSLLANEATHEQTDRMVAVLRHQGVLLDAPRRSHRDIDEAGAMKDPLVLFTHVNDQAFLRDSPSTGSGKSTSQFAVNYWPRWGTDAYHPTDIVIQRHYRFTVGFPTNFLSRIFSECCKVAPVVALWKWALVARVGAVEVLIRQNVHGTMVCNSLEVEARLSKGSVDGDEKVFRENVWSALHTYLLIIEYNIRLCPSLHVTINVPCQGSCAKRGETYVFSPMELHRKLGVGLPCPQCKTKGMSAEESLLLTGRLPCSGQHDYKDSMGAGQYSNPLAPYSLSWSCHMSDPSLPLWICSYCGTFKDASIKLMTMESRLYPAMAEDSFQVLTATEQCTALDPAPMHGNIVTGSRGQLTVVVCKSLLYTSASVHMTVLTAAPVQLVIALDAYLKSDIVDDAGFLNCSVHYECDSGRLTATDDHETNTKKMTTVDNLTIGDRLTVQMLREVLLDTGESTSLVLEICLLKNDCVFYTGLVPYRSSVAFVLPMATDEGAPTAKIVLSCPKHSRVTVSHFPLGSALLYKTNVGNHWALGMVLGSSRGLLQVGEDLNSPHPVLLPADSQDLLSLSFYSEGMTVISGKDVVKGADDLMAYLKNHDAIPAPFGLFKHADKSKVPPVKLFSSYQPRSCTVHSNSSQVLHQSYRHFLSTTGKNAAKRSTYPVMLLPAELSDNILLNPLRHTLQNWNKQAVHQVCSGAPWVLTDIVEQDSHFMDTDAISISRDDTHKFFSVMIHHLLRTCHFLSQNKALVAEWKRMLPSISETMPQEEVVEGLLAMMDVYKYMLLLLESRQTGVAASHKSVKMVRAKATRDFVNNLLQVPPDKITVGDVVLSSEKTDKCFTHGLLSKKSFDVSVVAENVGEYLPCVAQLSLYNIDLSSHIPVFFQLFPNLVNLSLINCSLGTLVGLTPCCPSLVLLVVSNNCIVEIPDEFEELRDSLKYLDISMNPVRRIPDFLTRFHRMRHLDVSNTLVGEFPEDIGRMRVLRNLHVRHTLIGRLPRSFSRLRYLERLDLDGVPWVTREEVQDSLSLETWKKWGKRTRALLEMSEEERIAMFSSCDHNKTSVLENDEIDELKMLMFDKFPRFGGDRNDCYGGVPKEIMALRNLRTLSLTYHNIHAIPKEMGQLYRLKSLFLSNNPYIETIDGAIGKSPLKVLMVSKCPLLRTPPQEIIDQGMMTVIAYLKRLSQGSVACLRTKLMFVGLGGAGKTSLMRALMSRDLQATSTDSEGITDGIDISTWTINKDQKSVTYSVWDFAGQTIYYNTHQFFLSNRAIYLLVWNTRLGYEHSGLEFWLSSISCHCPKAPIFVIGTHADQMTTSELPADALRARYSNITGFFTISSKTGQGMEELLKTLSTVTLEQPYIGEMVPEAWLNFEKNIMSKRNSKNVLKWEEMSGLANQAGVYGTEIKQAVQFLHELGTIQYFDNELLRNRVVISPQWIVDVMACVISVHNKVIKDGYLQHEDIHVIWKNYPKSLHKWLLHLTEVFDLTFPLTDQPTNIVPCLLPQVEPEFTWPTVSEADDVKETQMLYKFDYLPPGLFNRAQVRLYQFSDTSAMWKTGSVLKKNRHMALIQQLDDKLLMVKVTGQRPDNILLLVHEVFEDLIAEFFRGTHYEYQLPCRDCVQLRTKDPSMFSSRVLRRAVEKAQFLQCHNFFHVLSITEVQEAMPPQNSSDYELQLQHAIQDLDELGHDLGTDIFFLYSDADFPDGTNTTGFHPSKMQQDLEKEGFKCWYNEEMASKKLEDIAVVMKQAKLILVFISNEFVKDENCRKMFLFAKDTLMKRFLLAMVGQGREWSDSNIGMQVAHKVFVNFQREEHYSKRLKDLIGQLRQELHVQSQTKASDVFVSYCWANSQHALDRGQSRKVDGAIGAKDPRYIKELLEEEGLSCWIDIEKAGPKGLFEDIAEGMKTAKVVVACVSDQYALSRNCQMEFRFAHVTLRKPILLAVVGTGFKWEETEVGMLSLGYPKINFQVANEMAYTDLLQRVTETVDKHRETNVEESLTSVTCDKKASAFQESYESAQRRFLRQLAGYTESLEPYPRVFVPDFYHLNDTTKEQETPIEEAHFDFQDDVSSKLNKLKLPSQFCIKTLCEFEGGWHCVCEGVPVELGGSDLYTLWKLTAAYLAPLISLLRHSDVNLDIIRSEAGSNFLKFLTEENAGAGGHVGIQDVYSILWAYIIKKDVQDTKGNLARCYLPSGKTVWLCSEHQKLPRVTVLETADRVDSSEAETENAESDLLQQLLLKQQEENKDEQTAPDETHKDVTAPPVERAKKVIKKEKRPLQPLNLPTSPDDSTRIKGDEEKKDVKIRESPVARVTISPEEKKRMTDQMVEQLLSKSSKSQACVLL